MRVGGWAALIGRWGWGARWCATGGKAAVGAGGIELGDAEQNERGFAGGFGLAADEFCVLGAGVDVFVGGFFFADFGGEEVFAD